jgi:hypothetical protein
MPDTDIQVYVAALSVGEIFADATYQRPLDQARARKMADTWDRRLAGILEVSDRGESANPRYAVLDGQHRWAAAGLLPEHASLVANVHSGLSVADEAALFDKLNRQRKQITTWDHWRARRSAGDELVLSIEAAVAAAGLRVSEQTNSDGTVWCIGTLEKIAAAAGVDLVAATLKILSAAWGHQRAAYEAPIVHGLAMALDTFSDRIDADRLIDALSGIPPKRIRVTASTMRDTGMRGSLAKLSAIALVNQYNDQKSGRRLNWSASWKGVLRRSPLKPVPPVPGRDSGGDRETTAVADHPAATVKRSESHQPPAGGTASYSTVTSSVPSAPTAVPSALPPERTYTDEQAEAVDQRWPGQPIEVIANELDMSERTVRRILTDLGQLCAR